ncbi:magnesium-translocating P-type ATPase [candidate division WWE3 bacterium RIFOXYC1_FULL_40_10]|uniref:Magnesium-transporting ATPase, P-type 1 n=1 Tax=candidate division WWE3 bacterium RIFOXYA2_FULL_46_9 TaxID=1802636 RepID=A0A1F4W301_UNCKA|nr:MAG: magnesium-translocating P-type ATPase [candidate division WWE3 bacterium RIFOXYB1_FULL_40_22]OGC61945.1 MAG: magnesium-translocating P-type ATPase [candidate division WWE3 bacterium RIFOXYA1_FULL_40_11]OGC63771.1 MAG: magnesium-translocating P-type ATPase [candidate division WWE3 bacterium RIFOXYA2_FULL_46_9]OGC64502.1 MAG: magnesium-translocating P-type ATPase [candidate division WWE3 bacterium RIFOXYB2_FULL_41_6]OGC66328.1 MAG: magnesium-translocating P-type ATPase [candidate division
MLDAQIVNQKLESFATLQNSELFTKLETSEKGLIQAEAETRIKIYGRNVIKDRPKLHALIQFISNFKNPLVIILLVVSTISFVTGETVNGSLVAGMVLMSVTFNFWQEYKANTETDKLKAGIASISSVIRGGSRVEISTSELCLGDILVFNAGDLVPGECRILSSKDLYINQSALTGESFPAEKHATPIKIGDSEIAKMTNILFQGTSVISGTALAVVLKTGTKTEFGKIAESLAQNDSENEFTKGIGNFSMLTMKVVIFFVLFIFFVNALLKQNIIEALMFSVAVAVGLTPEFLPMIMSVTMAKGSMMMSKKGVIVKKLSAIPTFGSMDILCTDKTGTLTQDKIRLVKYIDTRGEYSEKVFSFSYLNSYFQTGISNPMDQAVIDFKKVDVSSYSKIDEIPFDFNRKRMSVIVGDNTNSHYLITKGAPEEVLGCCKLSPTEDHPGLLDKYLELSNEGYRVLAVATKILPNTKKVYEAEDEYDLELIGYIAFLDPPKEDALDAINKLEEMGIEIKIITGDNELVAKRICKEVGVNIKGVLLGHELRGLTHEELLHKVENLTIFARFSPDDKNRVIKAIKENKHVVGYMGDGINDSPSLKSADVGISVSNSVDVAKESADIVLTRKSLHLLADGVVEGRKTYANTMKYIMMGLSSNFGNMFSVLGAVIFLPFLPMLPIQILLNNFLYDISQITIPTDNVDSEYIKKPRRWNMKFIRNFMFVFGPISSLYDYVSYFALYTLFSSQPGNFQTGWFLESLATQTLVIHVIRTRKIPFIQSRPSKFLLLSTLTGVSIGWLIPHTKLGAFFGFSPLQPQVLLLIAGIVLTYLITVELAKQLFFRRFKEQLNYN